MFAITEWPNRFRDTLSRAHHANTGFPLQGLCTPVHSPIQSGVACEAESDGAESGTSRLEPSPRDAAVVCGKRAKDLPVAQPSHGVYLE